MDKLKEKYENEVNTEYNSIVSEYQSIIEQSNKDFETNNKILLEQNSSLTFRTTILKQEISTLTSEINDLKVKLNNLEFNLKSAEEQIQKIKDTIISVEDEIKQLDEKNCILNMEKTDVSLKIDVDNKINTLLKRDFRGYLLTNVIKFINNKCKEYCQVIFGNSDINFALDGNNIEVTYRDIYFENLSGGEKQKVDLIIQFSIRDMMSEFLEFSSNIIILDEIFDNLDSLGCNKVIDLISEKLNNVESLFIISHHADSLEIPYDNELIVIKNSNGISTIQG